jgi:hypothetical protein
MMEQYHRLRKLRLAWQYRKTLIELKLVQVSNELLAAESSIDDVSERLCRVDPEQIQFHDFAMQHLITKNKEKNNLNNNRESLKAKRHGDEFNERRCEKMETKQKAIIDQRNLDTQLLEIMENLLISRDD